MQRVRETRRGFPNRRGFRSLTVGEWCFLMRRRSGINLTEVAKMNNISHVALIRRERMLGQWELLRDFWNDYFDIEAKEGTA